MRVVRATIEHLPSVAALFTGYRTFYGRPRDDAGVRIFLTQRLTLGDSVVFLALGEENGGAKALGFAQLYPTFSSLGLARAWILNDLFTDPAHRREGVARALLGHVREFAIATEASYVELATAHSNAEAQALYESLSYERDEEYAHYALDLREDGGHDRPIA